MSFNFFGKDIYIKKSVLVVMIIFGLLVIGGIGYFIKKQDKPIIFETDTKTSNNANAINTGTSIETPSVSILKATSDISEEIKIYITGCVKKPGIVTIKKGQMIYDAVKAAGGLTEDADRNFNMVYILNENLWLKIKSKKESIKLNSPKQQTQITKSNIGANTKSNEAGEGTEIVRDSGGVRVSEAQKGASSKININTASADELDSALPGVGPKTAADIVDYRTKNGSFKSINDVLNVPGIGESKLKRFKDMITLY